MRRIALTTAAALAAAALSVLPGGPPASAQPPPAARQSLVVEPLGGHDIYTHTTASDYRVGPALMRSTGDLVYRYTCGPAPTGSGEVIRMATSGNGGSTWSSETVVLQPSTSGPEDVLGVCDPAIVKVDQDYFYLAYTGVASDGTRRLFVARAINPGGPFTKWNGTGWTGGVPAPLIDRDALAAGPSLVNRAGTIHLFYNTRITTGPAAGTYQTRHATATLGTNPSTWPTRLTADPGVAITHPGKYTGTDCVGSHWWADTDVKYDETTGKYLAITSDQSSYRWSALQAYESADATTFTRAIITRGDYRQGARNPGQLADPYGHLTPNATKAIGWAHSATCGQADLRYTTTTQNNLTTGAITQPLLASAADWHPDSGTWSIAPVGTTPRPRPPPARSTRPPWPPGQRPPPPPSRSASAAAPPSPNESGCTSPRPTPPTPPTSPATPPTSKQPAQPGPAVPEQGRIRQPGLQGGLRSRLDQLEPADHRPVRQRHQGLPQRRPRRGPLGHRRRPPLPRRLPRPDDLRRHRRLPQPGGRRQHADLGDTGRLGVPRRRRRLGASVRRHLQRHRRAASSTCRTITTAGISRDSSWATAPTPRHRPRIGSTTEWAGLALTNDGITRSWSTGGYVVFLRANGNLGIYKAGTGQVVADVPTGSTRGDRAPGPRREDRAQLPGLRRRPARPAHQLDRHQRTGLGHRRLRGRQPTDLATALTYAGNDAY